MTAPSGPRTPEIHLRAVERGDLAALFEQQLDAEGNRMAGTKPRSAAEFADVWERIFADPTVCARVIVLDGRVVGGISCFKVDGRDCVGYWIGREHWGRGIAKRALAAFLVEVPRRPLHATIARENVASARVLSACGFRSTGCHFSEETPRYVAGELETFVLE